jgi:carotenoid cleavage dioxygenase-like enzyme
VLSEDVMISPAADARSDYRLGFRGFDAELAGAELPVRGTLPPWLSGTLVRNGPARFGIGDQTYRHWFDGLAMLHRFEIRNGAVSYANRFLRSPAFLEAERTGRIARSEFATDPRRSPLAHVVALFRAEPSHNANVNVVPYRDGYLALTETPLPMHVDGTTLETHGPVAWDDAVAGHMTTAHPLHDPVRRATFNLFTLIGRSSTYQIVRIEDGTMRRTVIGTTTVSEPGYMHAFSITQRYVILAEYPLFVRPLDLLLRRKPFIDNYRWLPGNGTRFHVFDKDGQGLVATYEAPAFFAFHHVNAFDDGAAIVVDIAAYDDASIIDDFLLANVFEGSAPFARPAFRRYRLIPGRTAAEIDLGTSQSLELPRVATAQAGNPYRFAYGVASDDSERGIFNRIVKFDVDEQRAAEWSEARSYPGEPVFVARPDATDEDDGVLLSVVFDAQTVTSYLLVLDARDLREHARIEAPHRIPFGFHGMFRS